MKRLICLILSVVCLGTLIFSSACGKTENQSENQSENQEDTTVKKDFYIDDFEDEIFPYQNDCKNYLNCNGDCFVSDYAGVRNAVKPVIVKWTCNYSDVKSFKVEYSVNEDFSSSKEIIASNIENSVELFNLYKATKYYVRVTAERESGKETVTSFFNMTDKGPRVLKVDYIENVRDIGGYKTSSGKVTKQGLVIRGATLTPNSDPSYTHVVFTDSGKKFMSEELKISLEMDLRPASQNDNLKVSPIPDATLKYYAVNGYATIFDPGYRETCRKVFSEFAKPENYPIYIHCTGGADRTGTIVYVLNALLGVDEIELVQDYEFTSFSINGPRDTKQGIYYPYFKPFRDKFELYQGATLEKKAETYLKTIGITDNEISNIRAIMTGEIPVL